MLAVAKDSPRYDSTEYIVELQSGLQKELCSACPEGGYCRAASESIQTVYMCKQLHFHFIHKFLVICFIPGNSCGGMHAFTAFKCGFLLSRDTHTYVGDQREGRVPSYIQSFKIED